MPKQEKDLDFSKMTASEIFKELNNTIKRLEKRNKKIKERYYEPKIPKSQNISEVLFLMEIVKNTAI